MYLGVHARVVRLVSTQGVHARAGQPRMAYRTNPKDPLAPLREREEIRLVAEDAKRRKRLATVGSIGCVIAAFAVIFALAPSSAHRECHHVEVRWENAPEIPPSVWTTCVQKP